MPSHVKIFFRLSVAVFVWWASQIRFLIFPTQHEVAMIARLPPEFREPTVHANWKFFIFNVAVLGGLTLLFASLAAFKRQNWARWACSGLFALIEMIPFFIALYYGQLDLYWRNFFHLSSHPEAYVAPILILAAIIFVFTGNAKPWFKSAARG